MSDEAVLRRPIGWWLKEADARLDTAFDNVLTGHDVGRRGWQVLATLAQSPTTRTDVAAALATFDNPAVIGSTIDDLRSRGWVEEHDGVLRLSPDGLLMLQSLAPLVDRVRSLVTTALPDDDYATLVRLLAQLVAALPEPTR